MASSETKICVWCDTSGTVYCYGCRSVFCKKCRIIHDNIPGMKFHTMNELEDVNSWVFEVATECASHKLPFDFYCSNCKDNVCRECITKQHKGHTINDLDLVFKTTKSYAATQFSKMKEKLSELKSGYKRIQSVLELNSKKIKDIIKRKSYIKVTEIEDFEKLESDFLQKDLLSKERIYRKQTVACERLERLMKEGRTLTFYNTYRSMERDVDELYELNLQDIEPNRIPEFSLKSFGEDVAHSILQDFGISQSRTIKGQRSHLATTSLFDIGIPMFVAAIRIGQKYTSAAFSAINAPEDIHIIEWKSRNGLVSTTPTCILVDKSKNFLAFGHEAMNYMDVLHEYEDYYCFFTHFIHRIKKQKLDFNSSIEDDRKIIKIPVEQILTLSVKYVKEQIVSKIKSFYPQCCENHIVFVLTIPSHSESLKGIMKKAARQAKIKDDLQKIALEPDVAALYCEAFQLKNKRFKEFVFIDFEGVTTNITINQRQENGELDEIIPAIEGPWCDTEDEYLNFLTTLFGTENIERLKKEDFNAYMDVVAEFETKKRSFIAKQEVVITLPVGLVHQISSLRTVIKRSPYRDSVTIVGQKLHIKRETFLSIFKKTVDGLLEYLDELFHYPKVLAVKNVIVCGELFEYECFQMAIKNKFDSQKQIIVPRGAGSAVLKGAVLFGHLPKHVNAYKS